MTEQFVFEKKILWEFCANNRTKMLIANECKQRQINNQEHGSSRKSHYKMDAFSWVHAVNEENDNYSEKNGYEQNLHNNRQQSVAFHETETRARNILRDVSKFVFSFSFVSCFLGQYDVIFHWPNHH